MSGLKPRTHAVCLFNASEWTWLPSSPSSSQSLPVIGCAWQILPPTLNRGDCVWMSLLHVSSPSKAFFYKGELKKKKNYQPFHNVQAGPPMLEHKRSVYRSLLSCWHYRHVPPRRALKLGESVTGGHTKRGLCPVMNDCGWKFLEGSRRTG